MRFNMSLIFYYIKYPEMTDLIATIKSDNLGNVEEDMVISYLLDDGGSSLQSHIDFLEYCIDKLENHLINNANISSNSYGVVIINNTTKINFLYDEGKEYTINRLDLLKMMKFWVCFLKKKPIDQYVEKHNFN